MLTNQIIVGCVGGLSASKFKFKLPTVVSVFWVNHSAVRLFFPWLATISTALYGGCSWRAAHAVLMGFFKVKGLDLKLASAC